MQIEVKDNIGFTDDKTAIANISKDSYLHYNKNGNKLTAEPSRDGKIYYTCNGSKKNSKTECRRQKFFSRSHKVMIVNDVDIEGDTEGYLKRWHHCGAKKYRHYTIGLYEKRDN